MQAVAFLALQRMSTWGGRETVPLPPNFRLKSKALSRREQSSPDLRALLMSSTLALLCQLIVNPWPMMLLGKAKQRSLKPTSNITCPLK